MRKLLFILLLCLSPGWVWGQTNLYVDTDSGSDGNACTSTGASACATLSGAIGKIPSTISTAYVVHCKGTTADTAAVTIALKTGRSATNTITIQTDAADRHSGVWSTSKYRLIVTDSVAISAENPYTYLDGIQIQVISSGYSRNVISIGGTYSSGDEIRISNCIIRGNSSASYTQKAIGLYGADNLKSYIWNNIIYGIYAGGSSYGIHHSGTSSECYIYSNIVIGGLVSIRSEGGSMTVKNTYAGGCSYSSCLLGIGTQVDNASSDSSATGTDHDNIAVNTTNFTNVTAGSEDYRLPGTGSALYNVGTDTSGDSAPLNFTTDIQGGTRSGTWDIGADEYGVDGSTTTTSSTSTAATTSTSTTITSSTSTTTTLPTKKRLTTLGVG